MNFRTSILITMGIIAVSALPESCTSASLRREKITGVVVNMKKFKFDSKIVTIQKGQQITWINKDRVLHNVVFPKIKIKSKFLRKDQKFTLIFEQIGKYEYFCAPHKSMGMTGTVVVTDGKQNKRRNSRINRI